MILVFNNKHSWQAEQKSLLLTTHNDSLGNSSTCCGDIDLGSYGPAPLDRFFPEGFLSTFLFLANEDGWGHRKCLGVECAVLLLSSSDSGVDWLGCVDDAWGWSASSAPTVHVEDTIVFVYSWLFQLYGKISIWLFPHIRHRLSWESFSRSLLLHTLKSYIAAIACPYKVLTANQTGPSPARYHAKHLICGCNFSLDCNNCNHGS